MQSKHIPNLITGLRFALVLPLVWLLIQGHYALASCLFAIMGVSDAVDGLLAKHYRWHSKLGEYMDPLADKLMLVSTYLTLGWLGILPGWLVAAVIVRDVVIVSGALAFQLVTRRLAMEPTLLSKLNTGAQIALVLAAIFDQFLPIANVVLVALIVTVLATTVGSGLDYVFKWTRRTRSLSTQ
jgi:cardiolipin synthase (CMP-forming)